MSRKRKKYTQIMLPLPGGAVNQCVLLSEEDLEEKQPEDNLPVLMEKALAGSLSAGSLSRHREVLMREAIRTDNADALARLAPQKRVPLERFTELFSQAETAGSPDCLAWLLEYRKTHYQPGEFDDFEQHRLDQALGLAGPDYAALRRQLRLRYLREGAVVCGAKTQERTCEIPASIGGKPVVGVDAAAFYGLDPMPRLRRVFAEPETERQALREAKEGGTILFGRSLAGKKEPEAPLCWRVIRRQEERMLVLCEKAVAFLPYHPELQEVTWESCALRRWLNSVFLPLSFTDIERSAIVSCRVETPDNPHFGSAGGAPTEDSLFLPSAEEAAALLPEPVRALGTWWWLRTPGFDNSFAAAVNPDGRVVRLGSFVDADDYAVRPAMWLRTDAL